MTPAELALLQLIIGRAIDMAPELIAMMRSDSDIKIEDLMPTPREIQEQLIRAREGLEEPS